LTGVDSGYYYLLLEGEGGQVAQPKKYFYKAKIASFSLFYPIFLSFPFDFFPFSIHYELHLPTWPPPNLFLNTHLSVIPTCWWSAMFYLLSGKIVKSKKVAQKEDKQQIDHFAIGSRTQIYSLRSRPKNVHIVLKMNKKLSVLSEKRTRWYSEFSEISIFFPVINPVLRLYSQGENNSFLGIYREVFKKTY